MTPGKSKLLFAIGALLLIVVLGVALFDWNMLRGPISRYASEKLGRTVTIRGDLRVSLGKIALVEAGDVVVANARWGSQPRMAEVTKASVRIDILELLHRRVVLPSVALDHPTVLLETQADGTGNWMFGDPKKPAAAAPQIGSLRIDEGRLGFRDRTHETAVNLVIASAEKETQNPDAAIRFSGEGRLRSEPFSLKGVGGPLLALAQRGKPYHVEVSAAAGSTGASFAGAFIPFQLDSIDGLLSLHGADMSKLYPIIPVPIPWTPPYELSGPHARQREVGCAAPGWKNRQ